MASAIPPTSPTPVAELLGTSGAPPDLLGGSTVQVGGNPGDLATALGLPTGKTGPTPCLNSDGTHRLNTYVVPPGTVITGPLVLPATTGSGWTCIKSGGSLPLRGTRVNPSNAGAMFKINSLGRIAPDGISPYNDVAIDWSGISSGWRIIGLEATHPTTLPQYALLQTDSQNVSRLLLERCYLHGHAAGNGQIRAAYVSVNDFQMWDSWVSEFRWTENDTQGLFFSKMARGHVENTEVQATGENIMIADQGSTSPTTDITLKRLHLFKPLTWRRFLANGAPNPSWDGINWGVKELFEIKRGIRVLIEGSLLENNWGGQGQDGTGSLVNRDGASPAGTATIDVMYRSNVYMNCPSMFSSATVVGNDAAGILTRVAWLNNLGLNIGSWFMLFLYQNSDLWVEHNTCVPGDGVASVEPGGNQAIIKWQPINPSDPRPIVITRQTIRRNVIGKGLYGLRDDYAGIAMDTARANVIAPDRDWSENAVYGPALDAVCAGFTSVGTPAAIGLDVTASPATGGRLASNSPLKAGGANGGSDGKDLGVDFVALAAAQAGTVVIPVANFTYQQAPGTLTVQFFDQSSGPPNQWAWSGPFSSSQQNPGFTFAGPGPQTVSLVAANVQGTSQPFTQVITVAPLPSSRIVSISPQGNSASAEWLKYWTQPTLWPTARARINTIHLYYPNFWTVAQGASGGRGMEDLIGANAFTQMAAWGLDWEVEIWPLVLTAYRGHSALPDQIQAAIQALDNAANAGRPIKYIRMEWALFYGLSGDGGYIGSDRYTFDEMAADLKVLMDAIHAQHPLVLFGDQEVLQGNTRGYGSYHPSLGGGPVYGVPAMWESWLTACDNHGVQLAYMDADTLSNTGGAYPNFLSDMAEAKAICESHGVKFGCEVNEGGASYTDDQGFYTGSMILANGYKQAIGAPERVIFRSWQNTPNIPLNVPESAPYSMTRLVNDGLTTLLGGNPPVASFTVVQIPGTLSVQVTDTSTNTPTNWLYDWGDGTTTSGAQQSPSHLYAQAGPKTITLVAANVGGSSAPASVGITVVVNFDTLSDEQATVAGGRTIIPVQVAQINVGDLVVAAVNRADTVSIDSVFDTLGNVYVPFPGPTLLAIPNGAIKGRQFYTIATASGQNVTVTAQLGGPTVNFGRIIVRRYITPGVITFVGQVSSGPVFSQSPMNSGLLTVTAPVNLLLGFDNWDTTVPVAPAGWLFRNGTLAGDRLNAPPGSYAFQPTFTGTQNWVAQIAAFATNAVTPLQVTDRL